MLVAASASRSSRPDFHERASLLPGLALVGTPGPIAAWGFSLVGQLALLSGETTHVLDVDMFDDIDTAALAAEGPFIVRSLFPSRALASLVARERLGVVAFVDDPVEAVRYSQAASGSALAQAVRGQSASLSLMASVLNGADALIVSRRVPEPDAVELAHRIARHAGWMFDDPAAVLAATAGGVPGIGALRREGDADTASLVWSESDVRGIRDVLSGLSENVCGKSGGTVIWPASAFLSGDRPGEPAPAVADLTGPARVIFYGPYFHLPAGRWLATVRLGFSARASRSPYSIELHSAQPLAMVKIRPDTDGVFEVPISLSINEPEHGVEIRIRMNEGAIEGALSLLQVRFDALAIPIPDSRDV